MSEEPTEERTLPPSPKKLRDERRKGKAAQSRDLISAGGLLAVSLFLWLTWRTTRDHLVELARLASDFNAAPFEELVSRAIELSGRILLLLSAPLAAIVFFAASIAGIVASSGPVFSFDPIKPNFDHINPVKGFKRIFSLKNVVEFGKSVTKLVMLSATLWLVLRAWLQPLFETPACGLDCLTPMALAILKPMIAAAVLFFIVIGLLDVQIQRLLFLREMRMTKTEAKREHKEVEGDPLIRSERRRLQREMAQKPHFGVTDATVVITSLNQTVGLRYNIEDTPLPTIVASSQGAKAAEARAAARNLGIPIIEDPALAESLAKEHKPGDPVKSAHFDKVARLLFDLDLL